VDDSGGADYTRIQDAMIMRAMGIRYWLMAGTYIESVKVDKSVSLTGSGADITILKAVRGIYIIADYVNISGFTVRDAHIGVEDWEEPAGIYMKGVNYVNISNNILLKQ